MKKNFVKKLALAMALVVTATSVNVPAASAAATPGFKSTAVKVKVGETKKYNTKNTGTKSDKAKNRYSVSFKIGKTSIATIKYSKGSKAVKVTGVAAGKTTLRADFKNYATKKVTKVRIPVTVVEEKATMTVAAAGVKKLVVTFNKAMDTTTAVTVKKGTVSPNVASTIWAADAKSVTINMGSKLTKGTYDVTVGELKGSVAVEDETLTSIEFVGTNLVADPDVASTASISFKTLNQYNERMSISTTPTATSSFGVKTEVTTPCTTKQNGVVTVTDIPTMFQILGTTGTVTLVDTTKGVTATANVTYSAAASAKTMTVVGLYNSEDDVISDITRGEDVADYYVLAQLKDQYGNDLDSKFLNATATKITTTLIPGGNVAGVAAKWEDKTVGGVDYVALQLKDDGKTTASAKAVSGTFYFTFVNEKVGLLANASFTVNSGTVIKSLNIYANDTIYEDQPNELGFEAIDAAGNAVTKYSALAGNVKFNSTKVEFVKQADGSAKLIYTPAVTLVTDATHPSNKQTTITSFTASVNEVTTSNYFVKPVTLTVSQKRVPVEVVGLKTGTATAVASGSSMTLALKNILVEDQYANVMTVKEVVESGKTVVIQKVADDAATGYENGNIVLKADADKNLAADFTGAKTTTKVGVDATSSKAKEVTTFLLNIDGFTTTDKDGKVVAKTNSYELNLYTVDSSKASNLTIASVNDDYVVKAATGSALVATWAGNPKDLGVGSVEVTGTVGGKTVVIPTEQYQVTGNTGHVLNYDKNPETTLTATIEVTVDTADGPVVLTKEYTFSNTAPTLTTFIDNGVEEIEVSGDAILDYCELAKVFYLDDQYGSCSTYGNFSDKGVKYTVVDVTGDDVERTITYNATHEVKVTNAKGGKFTITAIYGNLTATKTIKVK